MVVFAVTKLADGTTHYCHNFDEVRSSISTLFNRESSSFSAISISGTEMSLEEWEALPEFGGW